MLLADSKKKKKKEKKLSSGAPENDLFHFPTQYFVPFFYFSKETNFNATKTD